MIIHDADHPFVERGVYHIGYGEMVDGYRHAFYDERRRRVRYSREPNHPADPRCPECNPAEEQTPQYLAERARLRAARGATTTDTEETP